MIVHFFVIFFQVQLQNGSIPNLQTVKPAKSNHVRFAGINGRLSPTENTNNSAASETIAVSPGFPFISPGSRLQNDSLLVESGTPIESRLGNLDSDLELSAQIAVPGVRLTRMKHGINNNLDESPVLEGGEENEPPNGGNRGGREKGKGQGKSGQRSTPRRGGKS